MAADRVASVYEHGDMARTSIFASAPSFPAESSLPPVVFNRGLPGLWGAVTSEQGEIFALWGVIGGVPGAEGATVTKLDRQTLANVWDVRLPQVEGSNVWNYPGAIALHPNGDIYVAYTTRIARVDAQTGNVKAIADLPAPNGVADTTYNGFAILSDGKILAKSHHRKSDCPFQGYRAFIECGVDGLPASALSVLDPTDLHQTARADAPELIGGRVSVVTWRGLEYVYLAGDSNVHRMVYREGRLETDPSWGPIRYRSSEQTPGTAVVGFGDYVVIQNNAIPSHKPMTVTAISQADSRKTFSIEPFPSLVTGWSFMPSKATTDWENRRVYTATAYDGLVALDFDPRSGFSVAWRADQSTGSFLTLVGGKSDRVLVAASIPEPLPDALGAPQHQSEDVVWRAAASGRVLHQERNLPRNFGLTLTPDGEGGILYATRSQGIYRLLPQRTEGVVPNE